MKSMPKISVIMGVYNCKDFKMLKKSIESICNQTFKDWEFIICDDGSSDNRTLDELQNYPELDSRIKIISYKENKGLSYALNECMKHASGEFIARQDDDDISHETRFEKQIAFLEENSEYAFVSCAANVFDSNGIYGEYRVTDKPTAKSFLWNNPFIHPATVFRRNVLEKTGGYRVAKVTRRCEDYDLFMTLYAMGEKGYNIQEKIYDYQIVNNNRKYRPLKYRIDEMKVRWTGFRKMGIMSPKALLCVFKPIAISFIPQFIFKQIRKKNHS